MNQRVRLEDWRSSEDLQVLGTKARGQMPGVLGAELQERRRERREAHLRLDLDTGTPQVLCLLFPYVLVVESGRRGY